MRKKPLPPASAPGYDPDFERLYRTIPQGQPNHMHVTPEPHQTDAEQGPPPTRRGRRAVRRILLVLLVIALCAGLWTGWKVIGNGIRVFGWDGLMSLFTTRELKGESSGRVTVLLAGNSADDPGHSGAALTDSIMLVSMDTKDKTAYMLSIPRDLYVDIPGHGYAKINEAYQDGESSGFREPGYAAGGMGLLQKTVSERFGVPIHYYALVNYTALKQAVDAVGGVTLTIDSTDSRGLYDPSPDLLNNRQPLVQLPNGEVTLNGTQALALSRARGNARGSYGFGTSDFARTAHQRQLLVALKDKAVSAGTLANPIKLGELFDAFGANVATDMSMGEARRFYGLMSDVPSAAIASVSLNDVKGTTMLQNYRTRSGQSALVPRQGIDDYSEIQAYLGGL